MCCTISYMCHVWHRYPYSLLLYLLLISSGYSLLYRLFSFQLFLFSYPSSVSLTSTPVMNFMHQTSWCNFFFFCLQFSFLHLSFPPALIFPFIWPQMTCHFSLQCTQLGTVGKTRRLMVGWIEEQGNEGRGRFEKTLILLFSQSLLFSPEDERTEVGWGVGRGWERKRDNPCHPPNPKAAMRLCFMYPFCKHIFPFHSIK